MTEIQQDSGLITVTIDGQEVKVKSGEVLIDACEEVGVDIPRFCYHKRMSQVGMCRMCIVEVDTCLLYTSPSPRDRTRSRMPSSA